MEIIKNNSFNPPESVIPDSSLKGSGALTALSIVAVLAFGAFISYLLLEKQRQREANSQYY